MAFELDVRAYLSKSILDTGLRMVKDARYLSEESAAASPMGVARPALSYLAECTFFNRATAQLVTGGMPDISPASRQSYYGSVKTLDQASGELEASVRDLAAAVTTMDVDLLGKEIPMPWGPTPIFDLLHLTVVHLSYHDGQLNYVQTLYGDGANHWME